MRRSYLAVGLLVLVLLAGCGSGVGHKSVSSGSANARPATLVVHGDSEQAASVPSCNWPLHVVGDTSPSQVGLIRCYLRAVADQSLPELGPLVIAHSDSPVTLTTADLRYPGSVHSGTATARFSTNESDPFDASVSIRFADGATADLEMDALNVMMRASRSWRLDLGTIPAGPSAPAPVSLPS